MPGLPDDQVYARIAAYASRLDDSDLDSDATIAALTWFANTVVPGADHAAITVTDGDALTTPAATDATAVAIDGIQQRRHEGPCLTSVTEGSCVVVNDLAHDDRWPRYRTDVLADTPVKAVLAVHLADYGGLRSALNIYADTQQAFGPRSVEVALMFADHAALAWDTSHRRQQLTQSPSTGALIDQAVGILMQHNNIDVDQAFDLIAEVIEHTGDSAIDVARRIVATTTPD